MKSQTDKALVAKWEALAREERDKASRAQARAREHASTGASSAQAIATEGALFHLEMERYWLARIDGLPAFRQACARAQAGAERAEFARRRDLLLNSLGYPGWGPNR